LLLQDAFKVFIQSPSKLFIQFRRLTMTSVLIDNGAECLGVGGIIGKEVAGM
jgi:hypothetical protein